MKPSLPTPVQAGAPVLAAIVAAQTEIAAALPDSDAVMRILARHAMTLTDATGASIAVRDGDELYFPVNEGFTAGWENTRFPVTSTLTGHCMLTGALYSVPDLDAVSPSRAQVARDASIRSFLAVPLFHRGQVMAVLSIAAPEPCAFSDTDILVAQLLVGLAGSALAHAQAYDELRAAMEDAQQSRAESAEFAGMIAHELGSPIAAVQHASEVLGLEALSAQQERARALIELETKALRLLAGDLRAASSQERDSFDLHPRVVSLGALLGEARDFALTAPGDHPILLDPVACVNVIADSGRIAQVLRNLITNAAKYSPPKAPIRIRARRDRDRVWIEVIDSGPGIDPLDAPFIFAKFVRGRQKAGSQASGLGLGLYLSKRIVEAHGGKLIAESAPGEGATFAFSVEVAA
ncbi:MAG: GAF domain-containing sensor histidine kinase [Chloroflexota bacterium]|nr:GAF domain-containing sensor histidine kinase [Chloroflexota bacterium]